MAQSSDANVSCEQHSSFLHSPIVAMADSQIYNIIADRVVNLPKITRFFVASPTALVPGLITILTTDWVAKIIPVSPRSALVPSCLASV